MEAEARAMHEIKAAAENSKAQMQKTVVKQYEGQQHPNCVSFPDSSSCFVADLATLKAEYERDIQQKEAARA